MTPDDVNTGSKVIDLMVALKSSLDARPYRELRELAPGARFRFFYQVDDARERGEPAEGVPVYVLIERGTGRASYRLADGHRTTKHVTISTVAGVTREFDVTGGDMDYCGLMAQVVRA